MKFGSGLICGYGDSILSSIENGDPSGVLIVVAIGPPAAGRAHIDASPGRSSAFSVARNDSSCFSCLPLRPNPESTLPGSGRRRPAATATIRNSNWRQTFCITHSNISIYTRKFATGCIRDGLRLLQNAGGSLIIELCTTWINLAGTTAEDLILPKTATRQKTETRTEKGTNNGAKIAPVQRTDDSDASSTRKLSIKNAANRSLNRLKKPTRNCSGNALPDGTRTTFRGKVRRGLPDGQDRRFLPSLYRPGSDRRRCDHWLCEPNDMVITSYRDHVQAMVKGMTPEAVMAELYGKEGGCVKGKGGSMHMFSKSSSSTADTALWAGRSALGPGWPTRRSTGIRARLRCAFLAKQP